MNLGFSGTGINCASHGLVEVDPRWVDFSKFLINESLTSALNFFFELKDESSNRKSKIIGQRSEVAFSWEFGNSQKIPKIQKNV